MELNQKSVGWLLEWLSIFPLGKTPFLGRGNAPAASPAPDLPCTGAAHGWKRHVARERGNQFFHKYSSSWSLVGRCARQGGYFPFPTWKDEFSFSDCLRQANAALRQPSCPLTSSLPWQGLPEICIPARDWLPQSCFAQTKSAWQQAKNSQRCCWERHRGGEGARLGQREGPRHALPSYCGIARGHGALNSLRVSVGLFKWQK